MRRHTLNKHTEAISYQVEGSMRVDPHNLAKHFSCLELREKASKLTGKAIEDIFSSQMSGLVQIKADFAMVETRLESGIPLIVRIPMSYFRGIGARFMVSETEGNPVICLLELVHDDPGLSLPVMVSADLEDAAIDWQSWSGRYNLAMLHWPLKASDYQPVEDHIGHGKGLKLLMPQSRRHHSQFAVRRPRFLTRRKVGMGEALPSLKGREIIARN